MPARKYFSWPVATMVTFLASGLLHDYAWSIVFYHSSATKSTTDFQERIFHPMWLKLTAYFLWNGAVMLLERPFCRWVPGVEWLSQRLPTPFVSTLVVLTALPVSHWYTGDWARGGFFTDFAHGLWHFRPTQ